MQPYCKRDSDTGVFCEFRTPEEHLQMAGSGF